MNRIQTRTWARVFTLTLFTIGILLIPNSSLLGQTPEEPKPKTEAELLKERLQQLEQTVTELKGQLDALEAAKKNPTPVIMDATYTPTAPGSTSASGTSAPKPKSKQDGEGENTFEIYGFAMLDAGYQFGANHPDWFDTLRTTKLPAFGGEFDPKGKTYWGVRQSRLGVKSTTPTKYGELKTIFEFELFGTGVDAGQTTFRLRHAYGELGQFGAGQYWTVFGDTDAFPNTFEYWGPPGLIWFRNVQFRWMPLKGRNAVTIGLERPGASADQGNYADRIELQDVRPRFSWPDLTGNVRFNRDWGHLQVAGILRSIRWKDTNDTDEFDFSGGALGMGVSVSSALNFTKNDVGRFQVTYGKGIQNYFNDAPVDVGIRTRDVALQSRGGVGGEPPIEGVALPIFGMSAFLDHKWNDKFSSAVGYSMINIENTNGQAPSAFRRGHYAIGNLAYYPIPNVTIAGELQYGARENFLDGYSSNDFRIQFGFKYNFSKPFKF